MTGVFSKIIFPLGDWKPSTPVYVVGWLYSGLSSGLLSFGIKGSATSVVIHTEEKSLRHGREKGEINMDDNLAFCFILH